MKTIKVVQLHNGKQQEITIEFNNGFYKIDSSDNLIVCTDCNKLISIHSKCCINCGCDLTYVIRHTYEVENQTQQKIFDSIKQQKEALITEIKDLCAVLKIKRYENCNLNNSVEDLMQIKSELYNKKLLLDRRKQIFSNIPVFCKKALENKGIYLYQLDNDVVEEIYEKSLQYDSVSMERLAIVKKRAYSLFVSALKKYYPNYTQDNKLLFKKYMEFISRDRIAYNKDDEFFLELKNIFFKEGRYIS